MRAAAAIVLAFVFALPARGAPFDSLALAQGKQEPALAALLKRAAVYVENFQKQLSGIVAEETYEQRVKKQSGGLSIERRKLRSDLLLVRPVGSDRYVEFRDVFEVDGRAVRDRQDRLTKLFLDPPSGAQSQLDRVVNESARFNIGRVFRTMNTPVMPLAFLHARYQPHFSFTLARDEETSGTTIAFLETARPTLIQTPGGGDLPARGRFWIEPATGAVTRSELSINDIQIRATVTVTYRADADLGFLAPAEMQEQYVAIRDEIEGRATYGKFRKFQVNVDETIKPVKP